MRITKNRGNARVGRLLSGHGLTAAAPAPATPELTSLTFSVGLFLGTLSEAATLHYVFNGSATPLAAADIRTAALAAIPVQSYAGLAGSNSGALNGVPTPPGTYYLHMVPQNGAGNMPATGGVATVTIVAGDITPPELTSLAYSSGNVTGNVDEASTLYYIFNGSAAPVAAATIRTSALAASPDQVIVVPTGTVTGSLVNVPTMPGTYYLHMVPEDATGNMPATGDVVTFVVAGTETYNYVLDHNGASSGIYSTDSVAVLGASLSGKKLGMATLAYFDGAKWAGTLMWVGDRTIGNQYTMITGNQMTWRNVAVKTTPALANPASAGWYFVVGMAHDTGVGGVPGDLYFWRNSSAAQLLDGLGSSEYTMTNWTALAIGYNGDSTPDNYSNVPIACPLTFEGDPTNLIAWVTNGGGALRNPHLYDDASDATITITHRWPMAQLAGSLPAFSVTDPALDDAIGAMDTWTLVSTMQWSNIPTPF